MNTILNFILTFLGLVFIFIVFIGFVINWRKLIWKTKSSVFRIVKEGIWYYPEKRFLWFFTVRMIDCNGDYEAFLDEDEAVDFIKRFLQDQQIIKGKFIDFQNLNKEYNEKV